MAQRNTVKTEHVRAELVAYAPEGVAAGKQMWWGLQFEHAAHWHTYWKNPGDIGRATQLSWNLPQGVTAGEIDWPAPQKLLIPPVVDYGYEGVILLPVPVTVGSEFKGSELDVKLKAAWLACRSTCIPESGEFALTVPASGTRTHKAAFEAAWAARPVPLPGVRGSASVAGDSLVVNVTGLTASAHNGQIEILPEIPRLIDHAAPVVTTWKGDLLEARMPLRKRHDELPASLPVVLKFGDGGKQAVRVELVSGAATPAATAANTTETAGPQGATNQPLFMALLLALVGGVILNLTPCVFPVLSLNILRMTKHAGERRATVMSGIAYTVGVVASLLTLAGALLFFRAVGMQLGWGFQLQSPLFVSAMAMLFFLIGLNLAGFFEVSIALPGNGGALRAENPTVDSFLTGALAVIVGSPCTAPFMGGAIGLAVTLPAVQALLVFAALGCGIALPFLVISLVPAVAKIMPRPGRWMVHFKMAMSFPVFATTVWYVWLLAQRSGAGGVVAILLLMVLAAFGIWLWKVTTGKNVWHRRLRIALLVLVVVAVWRAIPTLNTTAISEKAKAEAAGWKTWSAEEVKSLNSEGKPVMVAFGASWCPSCQINEANVLSDPAVLAELDRCGFTRFKADWTSQDPKITAALAELGLNGVPVYALYAANRAGSKPHLLGEILSKKGLMDAANQLGTCSSSAQLQQGEASAAKESCTLNDLRLGTHSQSKVLGARSG